VATLPEEDAQHGIQTVLAVWLGSICDGFLPDLFLSGLVPFATFFCQTCFSKSGLSRKWMPCDRQK